MSSVSAALPKILATMVRSGVIPRVTVSARQSKATPRPPVTVALGPLSGSIRVGDLIVFALDGQLLLERVVGATAADVIVCADATPDAVSRLPFERVIGRVVAAYAGAQADSPRIDGALWKFNGGLIARLRPARAAVKSIGASLQEWIELSGIVRPEPAFLALSRVMMAITRGDDDFLAKAIAAVRPDAFFRAALRHGCAGVIYDALTQKGLHERTNLNSLVSLLAAAHADIAARTPRLRQQITQVVAILDDASIPYALLKGAARIGTDAPGADLHPSADLDILIQPDRLDEAVAKFSAVGYRAKDGTAELMLHGRRHEMPLVPPAGGVCVELHVALSNPRLLSHRFDWAALEPNMQTVTASLGSVRCLDAYGTALHLAVHSIGLHKIRDVYLLAACFRREPALIGALDAVVKAERKDPVRLGAALAIAARFAGVERRGSADERKYLRWAIRREDMPPRLRSRVVEAWYGNGGTCFGPTTDYLSQARPIDRKHDFSPTQWVLVQAFSGAFAALYAATMQREVDEIYTA